MMEVRRVALQRFGRPAIPGGESLANLRRAFVPIWLLHRYQVEAAAKSLGGVDFPYALNREAVRRSRRPRSGRSKRRSTRCSIRLSPANLTVPPQLMPLLSGGFGGNSDRQTDIEIIPTAGGPVFDPLAATEVGAMQTLNALLSPQRLNRLEIQHSADPSVPAPAYVFDTLIGRASSGSGSDVGRRIATTRRSRWRGSSVMRRCRRPSRWSCRPGSTGSRTSSASRETTGAAGWPPCSRTARRSTRLSPIRAACRKCLRACPSAWTRTSSRAAEA